MSTLVAVIRQKSNVSSAIGYAASKSAYHHYLKQRLAIKNIKAQINIVHCCFRLFCFFVCLIVFFSLSCVCLIVCFGVFLLLFLLLLLLLLLMLFFSIFSNLPFRQSQFVAPVMSSASR